MPTLRSAFVLVALVSPVAAQSSIDLLNLTISNAQVIAGANVNAAKNSVFGQHMLAKIQPNDPQLLEFINNTGFDPRNDVAEIVLSTDSMPGPSAHWMIAARGNFGVTKGQVELQATNHGGTVTTAQGVDIIKPGAAGADAPAPNVCIAFYPNNVNAAIGDCDSIQAAVQPTAKTGDLLTKAQTIQSQQDLWFVSVLPLPKMSGAAPGAVNPVLNNPLLQKIQQTSGGVSFTATGGVPGAHISAQVVMTTAADATSLLNVLNFLTSMVQSQAGSQPAGATITSLLSALQITQADNALNVSLTIPETTLEQLVDMGPHAQARASRKQEQLK